MKKYSHIFFDLDRTLWDIEVNSNIVLSDMFNLFGLKDKLNTISDEFINVYKRYNDTVWKQYTAGQIGKMELRALRYNLTLNHFNYNDEKLAGELDNYYITNTPKQKTLMPYSLEVLDYLKSKDYKMAIVTNGFEDIQQVKVKSGGIEKYFEKIFSSETTGFAKPAKEIFDYALNYFGINAQNAIMIGDDWEADIMGATNAGIDQVYYTPINEDRKCTFKITCLKDLYNIL